ncbi:hypothetical protein BDV96DRAFT_572128 [Lophiotrema nucula]|uniref:Uncharacterized protein n=1 Tax=Lophiotrema nucula TaxID=690887 RepID=A0A6A5ZDY4_9PLEO|nr:hypothetical protein BDV96DRAFT_572128 [Lophiotrema nucula]
MSSLDRDFDALLNDPEIFQPCAQVTYVNSTRINSTTKFTILEKSDEDIPLICAAPPSQDAEWTLRLLLFPEVTPKGYPIPMSKFAWKAVNEHWGIGSALMYHYRRATGIAFARTVLHHDHTLQAIGLDFDTLGLTYLTITHDMANKDVRGLVFGLRADKLKDLKWRLESARDLGCHPLLAPLITTDMSVNDTRSAMITIAISLNKGIGPFTFKNVYGHRGYNEAPDLGALPFTLTELAIYANESGKRLKRLEAMLQFIDEQFASSTMNIDLNTHMKERMGHHITQVKEDARSIQPNIVEVQQNIQTGVQLVYALLAQKDNELNHRYGADMRVIAAVTLAFLPGTFMATLFSASFWDFNPNNARPRVSKWVWVYWITTFGLTAVVMILWRGHPTLATLRKRWQRRNHSEGVEKKEA